jgi:hypothetical protein
MGQAGSKMRRQERGFVWWCPACKETHPLPDGWKFNGDLEHPTFRPSFKHGPSIRIVTDEHGEWLGRWYMRDESGALVERVQRQSGDVPVMWCCHYFITSGFVKYEGDCSHDLKGKVRAMPALPPFFCDP